MIRVVNIVCYKLTYRCILQRYECLRNHFLFTFICFLPCHSADSKPTLLSPTPFHRCSLQVFIGHCAVTYLMKINIQFQYNMVFRNVLCSYFRQLLYLFTQSEAIILLMFLSSMFKVVAVHLHVSASRLVD